VEPSDELGIRLHVESSSTIPSAETIKVRAPFSLALEVAHLSFQTRQVMLMIDPGEANVHK
jgi:hypothetical protein